MFAKRREITFCITLQLLLNLVLYLNSQPRSSTLGHASDGSHPIGQKIVIERPSECRSAAIFRCEHCIPFQQTYNEGEKIARLRASDSLWAFNVDRDARNYGLTDQQCDLAFPGLFEDILLSAKHKSESHISEKEFYDTKWPNGTLVLRVYNNQLYVVENIAPHRFAVRAKATLQAINRAITTSPEPLPNIKFAIVTGDFAPSLELPVWSYSRTAEDHEIWLMPDYGFWSYGYDNRPSALGSWTSVRNSMRAVEAAYPNFYSKIPKVFWRGETELTERLRADLVQRTRNKPWADVQQVRAWNPNDEGAISIHEHCRYMFLVYTEGVSYSGRLKYLQNCRSLIFAHTLEWIQPSEYLMVSSGPKQNYVEVARDFSDLAAKVEYYIANMKEAEIIANNSVATFRDRYLTPASETCYWRKLMHAWRSVTFEPDITTQQLGTAFEDYVLQMG